MLKILSLLMFLSSLGIVNTGDYESTTSPIYYAIYDNPDYIIWQTSMKQNIPRPIATTTNGWFRLSPDRSELLLLQLREGNIAEYDIAIVDVASLEQHRITNSGANYAPIWSPSGNQIAFIRETETEYEIVVKAILLEADEVSVYQSEGFISSISWSSDGDNIAFIQCLTDNECDAFLLDTTSNRITNITHNLAASVLEIAWSPDSSELAFTAYSNDDLKNTNMYVADIETAQITSFNLRTAEYKHMEWSPNGEVIAVASNLDGDWDIFLIILETMKSMNLTNNENMQDGFWGLTIALDSDYLAYSSGPIDGDFGIFTTPIDNFDTIQITDDEFHSVYPAWH